MNEEEKGKCPLIAERCRTRRGARRSTATEGGLMLDPGTFGNSKAAVVLAEKLDQLGMPRLTRRVGCFLHTYGEYMNAVRAVGDEKVRRGLRLMVRDKFRHDVEELPPEVVTYVRNLILMKFRVEQRAEQETPKS